MKRAVSVLELHELVRSWMKTKMVQLHRLVKWQELAMVVVLLLLLLQHRHSIGASPKALALIALIGLLQ